MNAKEQRKLCVDILKDYGFNVSKSNGVYKIDKMIAEVTSAQWSVKEQEFGWVHCIYLLYLHGNPTVIPLLDSLGAQFNEGAKALLEKG